MSSPASVTDEVLLSGTGALLTDGMDPLDNYGY